MKNNDLISVIIPVYNAEKFIEDTIKNVLEQTYQKFEIILINDCSQDNSKKIINKYKNSDKRITLINNKKNKGAAESRNEGIKIARGRFICFLDADDKWEKNKLEKQIKFIKKKKCIFSYTSYQFADKYCNPTGAKVIVPEKISYKQALKNTTIWTSTVMLDMKKLNKEDVFMPNIKSEDTALWWKLLRTKVKYAYGLKDILSYYRRTNGTLSSNKYEAIKRVWNLYRNYEKLSLLNSIYNFCWYAFNAVRRRI